MHVIEYDGKSLLSFTQSKSSGASQNDVAVGSQDQSSSFDYQLNLPSFPPPITAEQHTLNPGQSIGGKYVFLYNLKCGCRNTNSIPSAFSFSSLKMNNQVIYYICLNFLIIVLFVDMYMLI